MGDEEGWSDKDEITCQAHLDELREEQNYIGAIPGKHAHQFCQQGETSVAVQLGRPIVVPEGQYVSATNGVLKIVDVDISQKVAHALHSALDPDKLKTTIPSELKKLNMTVQSAGFKDDGGHLVAEVVLTSNVPWGDVANALKQIQSPPATP